MGGLEAVTDWVVLTWRRSGWRRYFGLGLYPGSRSSGSGIMMTADGNVVAGRSKSWTATRR